ncbi:hypothetical protein J2Z22_000814 [Paenibacillus forsythiae]|uniref:Copper amine oxidase-like N-terminal domain-containing protein n=1 Tax=Paenibacillus forsythiae TaxID=365616 RepID=A0ABU3H3A1_9BACL|nr:stalk domain-containing protein [Paenibacillus forsythiae]MDT3425298.1 hypothetical protein [Paenibacillus forsythiae]
MPNQLVKNIIVFCLVLVFLPASSIRAASVITDPALAKAIRAELKLSANKELGAGDLQKLKSLYPMDVQDKITDLQGLEYAVNMQSLFLPGQHIKNITALGKLNKLTSLAVEGNQITDLSPLSGLSSLQKLVVDDNKIKSLIPLKNLHKLTDLLASNNQVADISPIQKLKLEWIMLSGNKIQDLTPLKNHPTLEHLYLDGNLIRDIEVLETIPNLREVSLANNPLNEQARQVVKQLESNGVIVDLGNNDMTKPEEIQVSLDGESVDFEVSPFIIDGSVMVPFRTIFEKLGLKLTWIEDTQTIIGEKEGITIKMKLGQQSADVNGRPISLAVAPTIVSDSTFVPLRFVAESLDAKVEWDASRQLAIISRK